MGEIGAVAVPLTRLFAPARLRRRVRTETAILIRIVEAALVAVLAYLVVSFLYLGALEPPPPGGGPVRAQSAQAREDLAVLERITPFRRAAPLEDAVAAQPDTAPIAPETALDLTLNGVRFEADGASVAFITAPNEERKRFVIGDEIMAGVFLDGVYEERVILRRAGLRESLAFRSDEAGLFGQPERRVVVAQAAQPDLLDFVELRPRLSNGALDGFEIHWTERDALFRSFGLAPGDVLRAVNGAAALSGEQASELLDELRDAERITLTLERGGEMRDVEIDLNELR